MIMPPDETNRSSLSVKSRMVHVGVLVDVSLSA